MTHCVVGGSSKYLCVNGTKAAIAARNAVVLMILKLYSCIRLEDEDNS
jgi:hypothetical protein